MELFLQRKRSGKFLFFHTMVLVKEKLAWTLCWHHKKDAGRVLVRHNRVTAESARERKRATWWWVVGVPSCSMRCVHGWMAGTADGQKSHPKC